MTSHVRHLGGDDIRGGTSSGNDIKGSVDGLEHEFEVRIMLSAFGVCAAVGAHEGRCWTETGRVKEGRWGGGGGRDGRLHC
jgi:hypothetical protein